MLRLNTGVGPAAMRYHRRMALKHAQTRCHGSSVPSVVSPSSMTRQNLSGGLEQNCERCGRPLIRKSPADMAPPDFIASPDYVGTSLCRNCMEEHCVQTNCLQCEIGHWPNCPYTYIKRLGLEKHADGAANNE